MMPYNHTKFRVETHQGAGSVEQKILKNPENPEKLNPGRGGGGGALLGGRPLWDISAYLRQHRRDITQIFMLDRPSDNIQTHKVLGPKSPRGMGGEQKKCNQKTSQIGIPTAAGAARAALPISRMSRGSCRESRMRLLREIANAQIENPETENQKSLKSPLWQTYSSEPLGQAPVRTGADQGHRATGPQGCGAITAH